MRSFIAVLMLLIACGGTGSDKDSTPNDTNTGDDQAVEDADPTQDSDPSDTPTPEDTTQPPPDGNLPTEGGDTLFIGNSLLRHGANGPYQAYDIPAVIQAMRQSASSGGALQNFRVLAADGAGLGAWWNSFFGYRAADGSTVSAARAIVEDPENTRNYNSDLGYTALAPGSNGWDRIAVLSLANYVGQNQWQGNADDGAVVPNIQRWYQHIRASQPNAEILHYVGVTDGREIKTRQPPVDALYDGIKTEWGGRIVPVGRAFFDVDAASPNGGVFLRRPNANDYIHFSDDGVYLVACVFYAVLYGNPEGLSVPAGLNVANPEMLQSAAQAAVVRVGSAP